MQWRFCNSYVRPEWSLLTIRRIGIPGSVKVHPGPLDRIFDTIDRKLEEMEWLLNYARNANKPIPVESATTTKKVNAPRRSTPTKLLNPVTHHQTTKSDYAPEIKLRGPHFSATPCQICSLTGVSECNGDDSPIGQPLADNPYSESKVYCFSEGSEGFAFVLLCPTQ